MVGVNKEAKNRDGEVRADIAAVHEFGSKSGLIPKRELWRPVFEETMRWFQNPENKPERIFVNRVKRKYNV